MTFSSKDCNSLESKYVQMQTPTHPHTLTQCRTQVRVLTHTHERTHVHTCAWARVHAEKHLRWHILRVQRATKNVSPLKVGMIDLLTLSKNAHTGSLRNTIHLLSQTTLNSTQLPRVFPSQTLKPPASKINIKRFSPTTQGLGGHQRFCPPSKKMKIGDPVAEVELAAPNDPAMVPEDGPAHGFVFDEAMGVDPLLEDFSSFWWSYADEVLI